MEIRTITEIKVYGLNLNPMRSNIETSILVAVSTEKQKLIDWYTAQLAETSWLDSEDSGKTWRKNFKKNSYLEWYNPWNDFDQCDCFGHGIFEQWVHENTLHTLSVPLIQ